MAGSDLSCRWVLKVYREVYTLLTSNCSLKRPVPKVAFLVLRFDREIIHIRQPKESFKLPIIQSSFIRSEGKCCLQLYMAEMIWMMLVKFCVLVNVEVLNGS